MTTVGTGKYTYQVIENWAKLPAGQTFGNTSAVTTDSRDRVYVFQRKDPPVMIFDREGNFLDSWGAGVITDPHGICIHDDIVYLTDRSDSVALKFTLEGKPLQILGDRGGALGHRRRAARATWCPGPPGRSTTPPSWCPLRPATSTSPTDTATPGCTASPGMAGSFPPGASRARRGRTSSTCPTAYWWTRKRRCSSATGRITASRFFSADGQFREMWSDLRRPLDISMDRDGVLCVSEGAVSGLSARVSLLDKRGNVVARWDVNSAHGSWIDAHGDIYMALGRNGAGGQVRPAGIAPLSDRVMSVGGRSQTCPFIHSHAEASAGCSRSVRPSPLKKTRAVAVNRRSTLDQLAMS